MFTGLVESVGTMRWLRRTLKNVELSLSVSKDFAGSLSLGDSVAVNGCCLTVTQKKKEVLVFNLLEETLKCTNLGDLRSEMHVNLERALLANGRLGGHFVQGHVDHVANVRKIDHKDRDVRLEIDLAAKDAHYVARKGSITINGVSLTVAEVGVDFFAVWIIPHTLRHTNLGTLEAGSRVNLEFDVLAKYVERFLECRNAPERTEG